MKIAVTYENGNVFQHFGHTEEFKLYNVENGKITKTDIVKPTEGGHSALAGFLMENKIDTLICGGIGGGAQTALAELGIKLYGGVSGSADDAVNALIKGALSFNPDVHCNHFESHHGGEEVHHCHGADGCAHKK
ncbi:MAG: NifB/NifX family molybdenum-iron cluster-binding protein [Clostridia bacterium]